MNARDVLRIVAQAEPRMRREFLRYVFNVTSTANVRAIERLVIAGDVEGILRTLDIDEERLNDFVESVRSIFIQGGTLEAASLPSSLRIRFNVRNEAAERWLREQSSRLVTDIVRSQREAIRVTLSAGQMRGIAPRNTALNIVGRVSAETGRRAGGVIGLTSQQSQFVANARTELATLNENYFGRARRDKRFDGVVRRAIESGKPLKQEQIDRITGRYSDRLLQLRAETIARTETMQALNAGRDNVFQNAIARGQIRQENVTKVWRSAGDARVRDTHARLNGNRVAMEAAFVTANGARLMYPMDRSQGAPAEEIIDCRCVAEYKVDFLAERLGSRRG